MKPKLYVETTFPSYLTSRPSRDLIIAGHQQITREWWYQRSDAFQLYISQLVVDEASAGDPGAARERLKVIQHLPLLDITPDVVVLASSILASGSIPRKAATDAGIAKGLASVCRQHGFECPVICTPEELLGE